MSSRNGKQRRRGIAAVVVVLVIAPACAPTARVEIGVREAPVNVRFGDGRDEPPPPAIGVPVSGIGPIGGPVRLDRPRRTDREEPAPSCPVAPVNRGAEEAAPTAVSAGPEPGRYRFRRTGTMRAGAPGTTIESLSAVSPQSLSPVLLQEVTDVVETPIPGGSPRISFNVVTTEPGLRTTTSYLIDPLGVNADPRSSAGLKVTRIVLERSDLPGDSPRGVLGPTAIETFEPTPPVKLMNLPAVVEPAPTDAFTSSRGVDPTTDASMEVFSATETRASVDVCGRVIQGWRVRVSFAATAGLTLRSSYDRPEVRTYQFSGDFVFAPQFSLIVEQNMSFRGTEVGGRPFEMHTRSTINSLTPA